MTWGGKRHGTEERAAARNARLIPFVQLEAHAAAVREIGADFPHAARLGAEAPEGAKLISSPAPSGMGSRLPLIFMRNFPSPMLSNLPYTLSEID